MTHVTPRRIADAERPSAGAATREGVLDALAAVAVLGKDAASVAQAARELAAGQTTVREVVLIDLFDADGPSGEGAGDGAEGIYDVLEFGLSLQHVVKPLAPASRVRVVQPGTCSPLDDAVLANPRWTTLVAKARRNGTLLLIAAPAGIPALPLLTEQLDGTVLVGEVPAPASGTPVLFRMRDRTRSGRNPLPRPAEHQAIPRPRPWRRATLVATVATVGLAFAAWRYRSAWGPLLPASLRGPEATQAVATMQGMAPGEVVSTESGGWSVEIESVNSAASAMYVIRQQVTTLPAPTYVPAPEDASHVGWYRVLAGAFASRTDAESLLVALRDSGVLLPGAGSVLRAPYAWQLEEDLTPVVAVERVAAWRQEGVPAYTLPQADGSMRIYVGAFETEDAARTLTPTLDSLHIHAILVPRVGSNR